MWQNDLSPVNSRLFCGNGRLFPLISSLNSILVSAVSALLAILGMVYCNPCHTHHVSRWDTSARHEKTKLEQEAYFFFFFLFHFESTHIQSEERLTAPRAAPPFNLPTPAWFLLLLFSARSLNGPDNRTVFMCLKINDLLVTEADSEVQFRHKAFCGGSHMC